MKWFHAGRRVLEVLAFLLAVVCFIGYLCEHVSWLRFCFVSFLIEAVMFFTGIIFDRWDKYDASWGFLSSIGCGAYYVLYLFYVRDYLQVAMPLWLVLLGIVPATFILYSQIFMTRKQGNRHKR